MSLITCKHPWELFKDKSGLQGKSFRNGILIRQILQEPVQGVRRGSGGGPEESPEGGCRGGDFSGLVGERSACIIAITKCNSERVFWPGSWGGTLKAPEGGQANRLTTQKC